MSSITSLSALAQFGIMLAIIFGVLGVLMEMMKASFHWSFVAKHRIRSELPRKVDDREYQRSTILNSVLSTFMFLGASFIFFDWWFYAGAIALGHVMIEVLMMLLLYDFLYYLLHRYVFHQSEIGRSWHIVHHRIRTPQAKDSLYIHPMETILGVLTMFLSIIVTGVISTQVLGGPGGIHILAFGIGFFIYSALNIFIHSAIHIPVFPMNILSTISDNHDHHHTSMRGGYYASITPIWDIVFKTNTPNVPMHAKARRSDD